MGDVLSAPFVGSRALAAGTLTRWELRNDFVRLHHDVYLRKGVRVDARVRALAASQWARGRGVVVGRSAAAIHGTRWLDDDVPAEIAVGTRSRPPDGILVYRDGIPSEEVCRVAGIAATTPARTAFDLGRRLPFHDAVVLLDALCRSTGCAVGCIETVADRHPRARGITRLRMALREMDPGAESPPETESPTAADRTRTTSPRNPIRIRNDVGAVIARADLGWPRWKVVVEYDGEQHWTDRRQRTWDIDRAAMLVALGWVIIRVGADLLYRRPQELIARVTNALRAAGAPV